MKPSSEKNFLSKEELENVLAGNSSAEEKLRMKKLLDDCELSKEAVAGFTAMPLAVGDIPALKKSIAIKSGMTVSIWMNVFVFTLGIALLIGMGYALWPREPILRATQIPPVMNALTEKKAPSISDVDLTPAAEHFVNPEMNTRKTATISSPQKIDSSAFNNSKQPILSNDKIKSIDTIFIVKPIVPIHPEVGYNSSVGFIYDLKITEFSTYYGKTIEVRELNLTGTPAEFEDDKSKNNSDKETVRNVPADQFLNEALFAFHNGHYGKCIEKMEVLQKNNPNDLNAIFYIAVSDVKLEMFAKAIPLFDQILNAQNNVFHEEANWYKALALIGNGNVDAAKKVLTEISNADGFYKEKAALKLKEVE